MKRSRIGRCIVAAMLVCFCLAAAAQAQTGTLVYPGGSNVNLRSGTVECWLQFGLDPREVFPSDEYLGLLSLVRVGTERAVISASYYAGSSMKPEAGWNVSAGPQPPMLPVTMHRVVWTPGDWHHVAITWDGNVMRFYADGKLAGEREQNVSFAQAVDAPDQVRILFGDVWGNRGRVILDEVRVSLVAREPEELGYHVGKLEPDPYTSVLDPLEGDFQPDGKMHTRPTIIFTGEGGLPSRPGEFVEGKFGKGLSLYPVGKRGE